MHDIWLIMAKSPRILLFFLRPPHAGWYSVVFSTTRSRTMSLPLACTMRATFSKTITGWSRYLPFHWHVTSLPLLL